VHAGLGLRYGLRQAKTVARPGDIILVAFEYQAYGEQGAFDPVLADYVMARDPTYLLSLDAFDLTRFVASVDADRIRRGVAALIAPPFRTPLDTAGEFDANGDDVRNETWRRTPQMAQAVRSAPPIRDLIDHTIPTRFTSKIVTSFVRWSQQHNVTIWATFPATAYLSSYASARTRENVSQIENMYRDLNVPVLEKAYELMWPADSFFDTQYHLLSEIADHRSARLAESVCHTAGWPVDLPSCSAGLATLSDGQFGRPKPDMDPMASVDRRRRHPRVSAKSTIPARLNTPSGRAF
jgi:hypothetical protein